MSSPEGGAGGLDSRDRFSATVAHYDDHRPDYPEALLDRLCAGLDDEALIIDVGAGTGILSRQLAARGHAVLAVEPNAAMRAECLRRAITGGHALSVVEGEATDLPVPDGVADLVVAAQAFHWFASEQTFAEWARVLKPGGQAAATWNFRLTGPEAGPHQALMDGYDALLAEFSTEYGVVTQGERALSWLESHAPPGMTRETFAHAQEHDLQGLLGRALSSSYVQHGVADLDGLRRGLEALFAAHEAGGRVRFPYRTELARWPRG